MKKRVKIAYTEKDFAVADFYHSAWDKAQVAETDKYWSGESAPEGRHFKSQLLWSDTALYVRFEGNQAEPIIMNAPPNLASKTNKLWEKDVCEIFLATDPEEFRRYYEFEVAPNGEWIDLMIHQMPDERETDWDYESGMEAGAKILDDKVIMTIKIGWEAFNRTPKEGDIWLGNMYRCLGEEPNRGLLAWSPTETAAPNFHVPEKFGEFEFVKSFES